MMSEGVAAIHIMSFLEELYTVFKDLKAKHYIDEFKPQKS